LVGRARDCLVRGWAPGSLDSSYEFTVRTFLTPKYTAAVKLISVKSIFWNVFPLNIFLQDLLPLRYFPLKYLPVKFLLLKCLPLFSLKISFKIFSFKMPWCDLSVYFMVHVEVLSVKSPVFKITVTKYQFFSIILF